MIKNAEEARRIIHSYNNTADPMLIETQNVFESKGYLVALGGPEVKALIHTIQEMSTISDAWNRSRVAATAITNYQSQRNWE